MSRVKSQPSDRARHARVIESLTAELNLPLKKVEFAYGIALKRLENEAAVTDFLTVFARRGARKCLLCVERRTQCATRADCLLIMGEVTAAERADPDSGPDVTAQ